MHLGYPIALREAYLAVSLACFLGLEMAKMQGFEIVVLWVVFWALVEKTHVLHIFLSCCDLVDLPAYMIVGLLVWSDATLSAGQTRSRERGVEVQVPALATAGAVAGVQLPLEIGNPAVGRRSSHDRQVRLSMSVQGSYIFALEYRAVRRKVYSTVERR